MSDVDHHHDESNIQHWSDRELLEFLAELDALQWDLVMSRLSDEQLGHLMKMGLLPRVPSRRNPWNLLLLLVVLIFLVGITVGLTLGSIWFSSLIAEQPARFNDRSEGLKAIVVVASLLVAMPSAMVLANRCLSLIGPARAAFDCEAAEAGATERRLDLPRYRKVVYGIAGGLAAIALLAAIFFK